jgi:Amt family ammonium transporter
LDLVGGIFISACKQDRCSSWLCRSRETVNVLMECIVDTCPGDRCYAFKLLSMLARHAVYRQILFSKIAATTAPGVAFLAFWLFQFCLR